MVATEQLPETIALRPVGDGNRADSGETLNPHCVGKLMASPDPAVTSGSLHNAAANLFRSPLLIESAIAIDTPSARSLAILSRIVSADSPRFDGR